MHPRPDARHIRAHDVSDLSALLAKDWPGIEFNIEGNPFHNLMDFVRELKPHQATFVPDSESQSTSDHGWSFPEDAERLRPVIAEAKALGVRVSLFMDPIPEMMAAVKAVGADRVELYTEGYAASRGTSNEAAVLARYVESARAAQAAGLGVNAGHDLSRDNLTAFPACRARRPGGLDRPRLHRRCARTGLRRHHAGVPALHRRGQVNAPAA